MHSSAERKGKAQRRVEEMQREIPFGFGVWSLVSFSVSSVGFFFFPSPLSLSPPLVWPFIFVCRLFSFTEIESGKPVNNRTRIFRTQSGSCSFKKTSNKLCVYPVPVLETTNRWANCAGDKRPDLSYWPWLQSILLIEKCLSVYKLSVFRLCKALFLQHRLPYPLSFS